MEDYREKLHLNVLVAEVHPLNRLAESIK